MCLYTDLVSRCTACDCDYELNKSCEPVECPVVREMPLTEDGKFRYGECNDVERQSFASKRGICPRCEREAEELREYQEANRRNALNGGFDKMGRSSNSRLR
ncbi:hypothetical protein HIM_03039 [Hirsutella minnesotensis 3608]|nr:hypothetical protein HIM_03039 [Hirsutella minnesotensis 3608]